MRGTILEQNYDGLPSKHKSLFLSVGRAVNDKDHMNTSSELENLYSFNNIGSSEYIYSLIAMLGNLNKQANSNKTHADYLNFVTEAIQRQDTIRSLPLSVEKFERFDELLLKLVLATRLESEFGSDIPIEFTELC